MVRLTQETRDQHTSAKNSRLNVKHTSLSHRQGSSAVHSVLNAAKRECSKVVSLADFFRSVCILPAAEKTRSSPAEEAGAAAASSSAAYGKDRQRFAKDRQRSASKGKIGKLNTMAKC